MKVEAQDAPRVEQDPRRRRGAREVLVPLLVIGLATVAAYSNTFGAAFQFDDLQEIVLSRKLHDLRNLWPPSGPRYIGLLSFALNHRWGDGVVGYHVVNLAIHVLNAFLVFWLARTTLETPVVVGADAGPLLRRHLPVAAGLLFAVHPVATQGVTYIVQRYASLATLFYLLAVVLYARARLCSRERASRVRAACTFCLALLAGAAAMRTKEISFTLPVALLGFELLLFRPRRRLLAPVPMFAVALLLLPVGQLTGGHPLADVMVDPSPFAAETQEIPRSVYFLTQSRVVVTYLRLLVLPVRQNLDYDFRLSSSIAEPSVLLAFAILLGVMAFAVLLLVRAARTNRAPGVLVFLGTAWFFVTLSVESSVIPIRDVIFEHRMYLPMAGAAIACGTALLHAVERLRLRVPLATQAAVVLALSAGPLAAAAYARNSVWRDDVTLWSDVVSKSPNKARGHEALGLAHLRRGETAVAISELEAALRLRPDSPSARRSLAAAYQARQLDDAVDEYGEAVRREPLDAEAHRGLGDALRAKGQLDLAVREYREALRLDPDLVEAHNNLGSAYDASGRADDAMREYREAIRLNAFVAAPHLNLGAAYHSSGRIEEAIREYRVAIGLDRSNPGAHVNLGAAYQHQGRLDEAIREYQEAIQLDPSLAEAHNNLGTAYEAKGQLGEALREYREATGLASLPARGRYHRLSAPQTSPRPSPR